jgi:hypothetical protein
MGLVVPYFLFCSHADTDDAKLVYVSEITLSIFLIFLRAFTLHLPVISSTGRIIWNEVDVENTPQYQTINKNSRIRGFPQFSYRPQTHTPR